MEKSTRIRWKTAAFLVAFGLLYAIAASSEEARHVREIIWAWGNPEMAKPGPHSLASFADASPTERADLLGAPNLFMAGLGLPESQEAATQLTRQAKRCSQLIWEITQGDTDGKPPFLFEKTVARIRRLASRYPNITGVMLDDMSSSMISNGLKPEHVRAIRDGLGKTNERVKLWGVLYSMNFDKPNIDAYINELDGIILAVWHAKDIPAMEKTVAHCETRYPGKPIILCLYLYDYGQDCRMPIELLEQQCDTSLRLAHAGRIKGILFVTINNDKRALEFARDWVDRVGGQTLGSFQDSALNLAGSGQWRFLGGEWIENDGIIRPPDKPNLHSRAFYTANAYADCEVEFEYNASYRETGTGSAGLIVRATDASHFYYVYFPWGGQQLRAKNFWAMAAKVDGDGYLRNLGAQWIPGLPSETDRWYAVRVRADGPRLRVWVDGRLALDFADDTYERGCLGFAGYGWYAFRNLRVRGVAKPPPVWNSELQIPTHSFMVGLSSETMPSGCVAPNGDVLIAAGSLLVRSKDKGRTWLPPETLPPSLGVVTDYGNSMFRSQDNKLRVMLYTTQKDANSPTPKVSMAESTDNGATWSEPVASTVDANWPKIPKNNTPYGPVTQGANGILMRFLLGSASDEDATFKDVRTWGATHCKASVIRSEDSGRTWSAPIEIDRPAWADVPRGGIPGSLDLTEPTAIVMGDDVMTLVRPVYSPYMWQCWSHDGGATWDAAVRATFPGYAQSMTRTVSGAILCAHRYPMYCVNVSRDGGIHWDAGTVIDYPAWAMGCLVEVEPDVVLCTYMNSQRNQPLLAQLIRVTCNGLRPSAPR